MSTEQLNNERRTDPRAPQRTRRWDILLIGVLLAIGLITLCLTRACRSPGTRVVVTVNGEVVGTYALTVNGEYVLNGGTNTLLIRDGAAYIIHSQCPDHRCERGRIRHAGESLTCLPNRVQVQVQGDASDVDATTGT